MLRAWMEAEGGLVEVTDAFSLKVLRKRAWLGHPLSLAATKPAEAET